MTVKTVTVPAVTLTLDQLLDVIRQLDAEGLNRVAAVVLEKTQNQSLSALRERLAQNEPATDISDEELAAEVKAVRTHRALQHPH